MLCDFDSYESRSYNICVTHVEHRSQKDESYGCQLLTTYDRLKQ